MFVRIFLCAAFTGPVLISIAKMLHAFEVPLCILAIFKYFAIHFNKALSATLYLVAFQLSSQLGNVILSTPLGSLRDQIGYQPTFFVISGVVFVAGLIAVFALKRDDECFLKTVEWDCLENHIGMLGEVIPVSRLDLYTQNVP